MLSLTGHVFRITNARAAFGPILFGDEQAPTVGFTPWVGVTVTATYYLAGAGTDFGFSLVAFTAPDGSLSITDLDPNPAAQNFPFDRVSLTVEFGFQGFGVPLYRSPVMSLLQAAAKELNIWLYPDIVPASDGVTAGAISQQVNSLGLPGNTTILSLPGAGLQFFGSQGQVNMEFIVGM